MIFPLIFDIRTGLEILQNLTNFGPDDSYNFKDNIITKNRRVIKSIPPESSWYQEKNEATGRITE